MAEDALHKVRDIYQPFTRRRHESSASSRANWLVTYMYMRKTSMTGNRAFSCP